MSDINYQAVIHRLTNITNHPNADRLRLTTIFGNTVIVGTGAKVDDLGIFFPLESQIGLEFAQANDLIRRKGEDGKPTGGMFDENRRVRAQKLRGVPSMGFWCPIEYLGKVVDISKLKEGDAFNELEGKTISIKYVPKTNRARNGNPGGKAPVRKPSKYIREQFPEHMDTEHLFRNLGRINPDDPMIVTIKLHGTSFRCGNVLVKRDLGLLERLSRFLGVKVQETDYELVIGSRTVIKTGESSGYYTKDLWTSVCNSTFKDKLHKGETIYGEIVGYVPGTESLIQKHYTYGLPVGQCEPYVYRITYTNPDGTVYELPWTALKKRCAELGVKHVPELTTKLCIGLMSEEGFVQFVTERFLNTPCWVDPKVPEEGICVRVEGHSLQIYKCKNFAFLELETKQLDTDDMDLETQQSEEVQTI